jgi:DNA-binding NtrC family response regulator
MPNPDIFVSQAVPIGVAPIGLNVSGSPNTREWVPPEIPSVRRVRVLVADDEPEIRKVVVRALWAAGFEAAAFQDGDEAFEYLRKTHGAADVILSDILMPKMDGIELAIRVKSEFPSMRMVLMTGYADISRDSKRSRGICEAILEKPFELHLLVDTVRRAARKKATY